MSLRCSSNPELALPAGFKLFLEMNLCDPLFFLFFFLCLFDIFLSFFFFPEILLGTGGVALPPAGRAHPEEPAAGGGEAASGPRGQPHHGHPSGSGGVLRAHLQPAARAGGGRWGHTRRRHTEYSDATGFSALNARCFSVRLCVDPASRRSGEPDISPSVRQPLLRLQ